MPHKERGPFPVAFTATILTVLSLQVTDLGKQTPFHGPPLGSNSIISSPFPFRSGGSHSFPRSWILGYFYTLCNHHFITMSSCEASRILFSAVTLTDILLYVSYQILNPNQQRGKKKYEHKVIDTGFQSQVYNFLAQWSRTNQLTYLSHNLKHGNNNNQLYMFVFVHWVFTKTLVLNMQLSRHYT